MTIYGWKCLASYIWHCWSAFTYWYVQINKLFWNRHWRLVHFYVDITLRRAVLKLAKHQQINHCMKMEILFVKSIIKQSSAYLQWLWFQTGAIAFETNCNYFLPFLHKNMTCLIRKCWIEVKAKLFLVLMDFCVAHLTLYSAQRNSAASIYTAMLSVHIQYSWNTTDHSEAPNPRERL